MSDNQFKVSFANAVASAQPAFQINRDENGNRTGFIGKDVVKVVTRVPVNVTLALLTSIESVVRAVFTVVTSVLYPITSRPFNYFKESTKATLNATVIALKGTVGYGVATAKETKKPAVTSEKTKVETQPSRLENAVRFVKSINKAHVAAGAAAAVVLYLFAGPVFRGLVAGTKEGFSTFGNSSSANLRSASTAVKGFGGMVGGAIAWPVHKLVNALSTNVTINNTTEGLNFTKEEMCPKI